MLAGKGLDLLEELLGEGVPGVFGAESAVEATFLPEDLQRLQALEVHRSVQGDPLQAYGHRPPPCHGLTGSLARKRGSSS